MNENKLPFDPENDEEISTWIAQNSTADLPGEEVKVTVKRKSKDLQLVSIRLNNEDMDKLKKIAHSNGIGYTTMARIIVHKALSDQLSDSTRSVDVT